MLSQDKKFESGEMICDRCNGIGRIEIEITKDSILPIKTFSCPKCHGSGKLTWLENIFGKEMYFILPDFSGKFLR